MKKSFLSIASIAIFGLTALAQKPADSPFSLEGVMNYSSGSGFDWQAPTIRARYFVNDNIAGRLQIGLGDGLGTAMSESYSFYENADGTGAVGTQDISRSAWNAQIGGEYHLSGTDKMSPYFSLGVNFGGGSYAENWSQFDGTAYAQGIDADVTGDFSSLGLAIGAGMDYYIRESIYIGLELGINYTSMTYGDVTTSVSVTAAGTTTSTTSVAPGYSESYLSTGAGNAALRLGWRF